MVLRGMRDEGGGMKKPSSFCQDRRPGFFHRAENLLIEVVRQFALKRRGGGSIDDLRDLGGVMRREGQTLAGSMNLAEPQLQFLFEQIGEGAADQIILEVRIIDVHRTNPSASSIWAPYATFTTRSSMETLGSIPRRRSSATYASRNARALSAVSHCVSASTVMSHAGF